MVEEVIGGARSILRLAHEAQTCSSEYAFQGEFPLLPVGHHLTEQLRRRDRGSGAEREHLHGITSAGSVRCGQRRTDLETVITDPLTGQFSSPVRVVAFNTAERWASPQKALITLK
jgi:hypothetical protein